MKTITVRLPENLAAEIETESRKDGISKSDVVRRRLERSPRTRGKATLSDLASDLIGSVDDERLPRDLSAQRKRYLAKSGYGRRNRR